MYACLGMHSRWELTKSEMLSIERNLQLQRPFRVDYLHKIRGLKAVEGNEQASAATKNSEAIFFSTRIERVVERSMQSSWNVPGGDGSVKYPTVVRKRLCCTEY